MKWAGTTPGRLQACQRHERFETCQEATAELAERDPVRFEGCVPWYCSAGTTGGHWHIGHPS